MSLEGPDAADFLQRLSTVNVRALEVGTGAPGCFLNAQGKIQASFWVWRYGPESFGFEVERGADDSWKKALTGFIDLYTFAEKQALTDVTELECAWVLGCPFGLAALSTQALEVGVRLCNHGDRDFGSPWISVWGRKAELQTWLAQQSEKDLDLRELEQARIHHLTPRVGAEITSEASPVEVGLRHAVADNKGCYPGQEVIEKVIALGSPARRLVRLSFQGSAPQAPSAVKTAGEGGQEVGTLTSVGGNEALALVKKIAAKQDLELQLSTGSLARIEEIAPYA